MLNVELKCLVTLKNNLRHFFYLQCYLANIYCVVFLSLFSLFISHIARNTPSSQIQNQLKIQLKLSQLIISPLLNLMQINSS